ncbi:MAG: HAD-IIB family hydrolase [Acidobacteriota bacterium]
MPRATLEEEVDAPDRRTEAPALLVFTDLDGTLLDHHDYSWRAAAPAIERLRRLGVPLILNSSKTRAEMLAIRHELGNAEPFVVENGSAIYRPRSGSPETFDVEWLGPPRASWLEALHAIREREGFRFEGFADFDLDRLRELTGLDAAAARAAAERDGTEPIVWLDERPPEALAEAIAGHDLRLVAGGRFWHVMGRSADKAYATRRISEQHRAQAPDVRTLALGDSGNDLGMLQEVDYPVVIPRATGEPLDPGPLPNLLYAPEPGAAGWRWAVDTLLDTLFES